MVAIQESGWAAKLFSSALFCLWLSIASVSVWFDADPAAPAMTARVQVPVADHRDAKSDAQDDAKRELSPPADTSPTPALTPGQAASRATPATGRLPDAA